MAASPPKPKALAPKFADMPAELTALAQWLLWRYVLRDGRWTKQPFSHIGRAGKSNDPSTWGTFDQVRAAYERGGYDGVGFAFAQGDGLVGLDLDHVLDRETGELLKPEAGELLAQFPGVYCEISPGGEGLRLFCLGVPQRCGKNIGKAKWLEIYDASSPRYLTITGQRFSAGGVIDGQHGLDWVDRRFMQAALAEAGHRPRDGSVSADDGALLERIRQSKQGPKFGRLWTGDAGDDHSAADLALCSILAFWTGGDWERTDKLFRQSGLFRPKWDKKHHADGRTYGDGTLAKAMESAAQVAPPAGRPTTAKARPATKTQMPPPAPAWPDPIIPQTANTPEIPAEMLPGWVGDMAGAVARWSQTPPEAAGMCSLSVLAAVLQRRFEVAPWGDDYREPLALWTLTTLPSGSRKTAILGAMQAPLVRWEKLERDRLRPEIARNYAAREVATKTIERLKIEAGKAKTAEDRQRLQDEIQHERENMPAELHAPRVFSGDVTGERLQQLLVEHDERMTVLSDEAGIFQIMGGQYSGGMANLDVFLQGHAGSPLRVDRAGRLAHIDRPALSFGLMLQPGVLADVAKAKRFRDSGLLARFAYAVPKSNVGSRDVRQRSPLPDAIKAGWEINILDMLDSMERPIGAPRVLAFTEPALELWLSFAEGTERGIGAGGRLEHISDWGSKLPGAVVRIAGLLELAANGTTTAAVGADSVRRAVELGGLLIDHAQAAFALMGAVQVDEDAMAVLRWIQARGLAEFTRREAQKALEGRFRSLDRLLAALAKLVEWYAISREHKRQGGGGRPSAFHVVNPGVLST